MSDGYAGQLSPTGAQSEFNELWFFVNQLINRRATATLVLVKACSNAGGVSPVGTVDVQPMVHQLDGAGNIVPHGVVYGLPYCRVQGGTSAVIIDPKPGDIGIAIFAAQDISTVKSTKKAAAPGSRRRFDMADGLYIGGVLNGAPTRYALFSDSGVTIVDPTQITLQAPTINLHGAVVGNSTAAFSGDVTGNGTSLHTHVHSDPQGGNTGQPV